MGTWEGGRGGFAAEGEGGLLMPLTPWLRSPPPPSFPITRGTVTRIDLDNATHPPGGGGGGLSGGTCGTVLRSKGGNTPPRQNKS